MSISTPGQMWLLRFLFSNLRMFPVEPGFALEELWYE